MQNQYLTANEVAELLKLNVETIYDMVGHGELPAAKIRGRWRFDASELRKWFKKHRSSTPKRPIKEESQSHR